MTLRTNRNRKIRVLVVDASAVVRQVLSLLINAQPDMEVVATSIDPLFAANKIQRLQPDVVTLEVDLPRMDGLSFLEQLMREDPVAVVMIASQTRPGAAATFRARELGALDCIAKPLTNVGQRLMTEYANELVTKIRRAAMATCSRQQPVSKLVPSPLANSRRLSLLRTVTASNDRALIAMGASTGGTHALRDILQALPADMPGMVITQHIPAAFAGSFAARINDQAALEVKLAADGEPIGRGRAYIAPGNQHLWVEAYRGGYRCRLSSREAPLINGHRPSVGVLFDSVARSAGPDALAVMLTGMGCDGAAAMLRLRQAGGATLAQDRDSSVVWGMPGAAVQAGAVEQQLPLKRIAEYLAHWSRRLKQAC